MRIFNNLSLLDCNIIEALGGYEQSIVRAGYLYHKWGLGLKHLPLIHCYTQTLIMCPLK